MHVSRIHSLYNTLTPNPGEKMTPQEYREQIDFILIVIRKCTTFDQLKALDKQHGHVPEIRQAINERACEITG